MDIINTIRNLIGLIFLTIAAIPFILAAVLLTRPVKGRLITAFLEIIVDKYTDDEFHGNNFKTKDGHTLHIAGETGAKYWTDECEWHGNDDRFLIFDNKNGHPVDSNGKPLPGKFE